MNKDNYKKAIDQIHPSDNLKRKTLEKMLEYRKKAGHPATIPPARKYYEKNRPSTLPSAADPAAGRLLFFSAHCHFPRQQHQRIGPECAGCPFGGSKAPL